MNAFLTWGYFVDICYGAKSIVTIYMKVYVCDEEVSNVMRRVKRSGCGLRE